jgi:hypothetical protein
MDKVYVNKSKLYISIDKFLGWFVEIIEKGITPFYCRRLRFIEAVQASYVTVTKDICGELYNCDQTKVMKLINESEFNKRLVLNPWIVFGLLFPTIYLEWVIFSLKYKKDDGSYNVMELAFINSKTYYLKKQVKYIQYKITGYKGYLK